MPLLTAQLGQLGERGLKARVSALGVGDQRNEQDILGGEEGQVVGGRVGATQPVGAERARVTDSIKNPGVPEPWSHPHKAEGGVTSKLLPAYTT